MKRQKVDQQNPQLVWGFKGRLLTATSISLGILVVLLAALLFVNRDIKTQALAIKTAKSDLKTRVQQLNDLARLREEANLAQPNLARLESAVPSRDGLFSVRRDIEGLAGRNNLAVSFDFGNENPKAGALGSINFELRLQGGDFGIRSFINQIESGYPFVKITALDMVREENDFIATVKGQISFGE